MLENLLPVLRTPTAYADGVHLLPDAPTRRGNGGLLTATLVGSSPSDPSFVRGGVWEAMGSRRPQRSLAQFTNALPMSPWFYESTWRAGAMTRFSGRVFPLTEELDEMFEAVGDTDGALIIDVGCSEGLYSRTLARRGARVLAIDHSRAYCRKAFKRAHQTGVQIAVARTVAQNIPVTDGAASAFVMGGTLNEIGESSTALAEAARVLAPGGRGYLVSLCGAMTRQGRIIQRVIDTTGIHFPTIEQTNALLAGAGLTITDQRVEGIAVRTFVTRLDESARHRSRLSG